MVIVRILIGVIHAILRSVSSALLVLFSTLATTLIVLLVVAFLGLSLTGVVTLRLRRRNRPR
jgi:hypothetical protein